MVGEIGSAYLEACTKKKGYIIAGPEEFGEQAGHTLVVLAALFGLWSFGARFHKKLADSLLEEGFHPTHADPDLWYREAGNCYEYACIYVNDLLFTGKDPATFYDTLIKKHNYKLKGVGPPKYHLGGNFECDKHGILTLGAQTYVTKLLDNYQQQYGSLPAKKTKPLPTDDHPELDDTSLLDSTGNMSFQSMIGTLQRCLQIDSSIYLQIDIIPLQIVGIICLQISITITLQILIIPLHMAIIPPQVVIIPLLKISIIPLDIPIICLILTG